MGTWGLGVALGGQPFKLWGLGQGDLGFRGGTWRQPFRFWGLGQGESGLLEDLKGCRGTRVLGVGLGDLPLGFGGWDRGTWGLGVRLGNLPLGFGGWDKGTWGLGVGLGDSTRFEVRD